MKPASLFPDPDLPIIPVADRSEPTLWVRRLVIVAARSPGAAVVRDVTFRPGLNVIRVEERPADESRPIGHSVGKTLMSRLLRYCLGESHFAVPDVVGRIAAGLPGAYAVAEIRVAGRWWVVARPLRDAAATESWAVHADDWRAGLGDPSGLLRYADFVAAVTAATVAALPELRLPGAGHSARWLDLLAWLARDQECSYQHCNEWRDPDANSGTGRLPRDDAGLLMQWAMGLLNAAEIDELTARQQLLRDQANAQAETEQLTHFLDSTRPGLLARLGLREEEMQGELFALHANHVVAERTRELQAQFNEYTEDARSGQLHDAAVRAARAEAVVEGEVAQLRGQRRAERPSPAEGADTPVLRTACPLERADCPLRSVAAACAPESGTGTAERGAVLALLDERIAALEGRLPPLREARAAAETLYAEEERKRRRGVAHALTHLGRWQLLSEQMAEYEKANRRREAVRERAESLDRQSRESRERQQAARDRSHRRLCDYFDRTLKKLVGPGASGSVRLDARGLHPEPDVSVAANGAALTTLATVLGLDLACLTATVCGVGHLPGFLLHDSPKEADLEPVLYERIFTLALELEAAFGKRPPTFQYIVTTTTPPPAAVTGPHVRLVLDARHDGGHFLKRRF